MRTSMLWSPQLRHPCCYQLSLDPDKSRLGMTTKQNIPGDTDMEAITFLKNRKGIC